MTAHFQKCVTRINAILQLNAAWIQIVQLAISVIALEIAV